MGASEALLMYVAAARIRVGWLFIALLPGTALSRGLGESGLPLVPDNPQGNDQTQSAGGEGDDVSGAVALEAVAARANAVLVDDGVGVEDGAVEEVEDVARDNRR